MILKNKIALITGAARGIGRATAQKFAGEGAVVIVGDINKEGTDRVVSEIEDAGGEGLSLKMDVSDEQEIKSVFSLIMDKYHTLDILMNNAGICRNVSIPDISSDEWDRYLKVNLKSVFLCSKEAIKIMKEKKYGKIINMGSAAAKIGGLVAGAHYAAAKAGVICFTKSLALQTAAYSINVNAIAPGPIATKMTEEWGKELKEAFIAKIPFKKYGTPEDVAEVALFLASDKSSYITGEVIDVNGGLIMD